MIQSQNEPNSRVYQITHETRYDYSQPVSLSLQTLRITPRSGRFRQSIETSPSGSLRFLRDAYENPSYSFEYIGEVDSLSVANHLKIVQHPSNPFDFLLSPEAIKRPISYNDSEKIALAPYLSAQVTDSPAVDAACDRFSPKNKDTVSFLIELNQNLYEGIRYQPRDEPGIYTTDELLQRGEGSCRDFAALLQAILRHEGFASRFVSGYLLETGDLRGAEAMHAWTDVYLPGAGWVPMDPTNGVLADSSFIPCAVSRLPDETTPVAGRYFAKTPVESRLSMNLEISRMESPQSGGSVG